MATVTVRVMSTVTIKATGEEAIALKQFLGCSSKDNMKTKGLTDEQAELLLDLYHKLPDVA